MTTAVEKKDFKGRVLQGTVVSVARDKSITVRVDRKVQHPLYRKIIKKSMKVHAHDEKNQCQNGDFVSIRECPPISKTKTWSLYKIEKK